MKTFTKLAASAGAVTLATIALAGCTSQTPEERVQRTVEAFIADGATQDSSGVCIPDGSVTGGIEDTATIASMEQVAVHTDGADIWEVDLAGGAGYLRVLVGESACILTAVPWSG